jgi:predicted enzyme related to lactoylglutathione lyase
MSETLRGRFVWHELLTSDPKAAAAFYGKIVGWAPQAWDKDPSYTLLTMGGRPVAGAMVLPEAAKAMGAPPHWFSHIGTSNVDVTARQAIELGGRVLKPAADVPGEGRFAVLQDPQGAVFGAYTPKQAPAGDTKPGLGEFSWHELMTTDWPSAFTFYQTLFGWEKTEAMDMGPGGTYQMFGWKGNTLGGMMNKPTGMPGPPFWLPYAIVSDAKSVAETVKKLGGKVVNGPMEVPGGDWIVQGMDLQGVMFAVHSKKKVAAARPAKKSKPVKKSKPAAKRKPAAKPKPTKRKSKSAAKKKPRKRAQKKSKKGGRRR